MTVSVNVIARDSRVGLRHHRDLAASVLETNGFRVRLLGSGEVTQWTKAQYDAARSAPFDLNLTFEAFYPLLFELARRQIFIPNQEWFAEQDTIHLKVLDAVVCTSMHATQIFSQLGCRTVYAGFTSHDRRLPVPVPPRREFLCLKSNAVHRVLAVWQRHPEWPRLTVTSDESVAQVEAPNIRHIREFLPLEETVRMQNEHLFHLCVTRVEAFGHKLNEGLSCGRVVITTDAPPMNELVAPDRGLLVKIANSEPHGLGIAYDFDEAALERTVERCAGMPAQEIEQICRNARGWFEENDRAFRDRFPKVLRSLV